MRKHMFWENLMFVKKKNFGKNIKTSGIFSKNFFFLFKKFEVAYC